MTTPLNRLRRTDFDPDYYFPPDEHIEMEDEPMEDEPKRDKPSPETLARKVGQINLATHAELDRAIAEALTALKHPETLARARAEEARVTELLDECAHGGATCQP